jgi:hypothetical protein
MKILLTPRTGRNRLTCLRTDGTSTTADVGPGLPGHDLAHFVVERRLALPVGFFVNIAKGFSIQQLSDPDTLRRLGPAPLVAEILARGVGSLLTGACTPEQFQELVGTELAGIDLAMPPGVDTDSARGMLEELGGLLERFRALAPGESLELEFPEGCPA